MASTDATGSGTRYAEAVLLGLLAHELLAGVVFWAIGLRGAAGFLWVVGTGLALGYALIWLTWQLRAPRHRPRLVIAVILVAAMITAAVTEAFVIGNALGTVLVAAAFLADRQRGPSDHREDTEDRSAFPRLAGWRPASGGRASRIRRMGSHVHNGSN